MQLEQKNLEQKCEKLHESNREKEKAKQQLQRLYISLKQQHVAAGLEVAAEHDADNVLGAAQYNTANHPNGPSRVSRAGSKGSGHGGERHNPAGFWQTGGQGSRAGLQSARMYCSTL